MRTIQTGKTFNQGLETVELQMFFETFPESEFIKLTLEPEESSSGAETAYGVIHFSPTTTKPETTIFFLNPSEDNEKPEPQDGNADIVRFEVAESVILMLNNGIPYALPIADIRFSPTDILASPDLPEKIKNFFHDITNIAKAWKSKGEVGFWPWEPEFDPSESFITDATPVPNETGDEPQNGEEPTEGIETPYNSEGAE